MGIFYLNFVFNYHYAYGVVGQIQLCVKDCVMDIVSDHTKVILTYINIMHASGVDGMWVCHELRCKM